MRPLLASALRSTLTMGLAGALTISVAASGQAAAELPSAPSDRGDVAATLQWSDCPVAAAPTMQCATLPVPMDYSRPKGRTFKLAVVRIPATGAKSGSLFLNPGGPGGSGTTGLPVFAPLMSASVRATFDIVSWDPRGVGNTRPALENCAQPSVQMPETAEVDWAKVQRKASKTLAAANRVCQRSNMSFINAIGTNNVARDLDRLRAAVGDKKLNFWGMSYGTHVGYVYATMFPGRIRSMVLDGNMTPLQGFAGVAATGGLAPDSALSFMRKNYPSGYDAITSTADALTAAPIPLGNGVSLTRWTWLGIVMSAVTQQQEWPRLATTAAIVGVAREDTEQGAQARALLRQAVGAPDTNAGGVFSAVECIDYPQRLTNSQQLKLVKRNAAKGPWFGGTLTTDYARGCAGLTLTADPIPRLNSAANRATVAGVKAVISNSTHDGSTPMAWAKQMHRAFGKSAFVRYRSGQHVIWNLVPSSCVKAPIDRYVLTGRLPRSPRTCTFVEPQADARSALA